MPSLTRPLFLLRLLLLAAFAALTACSPLPVINALVPSGTYKIQRDIAYGEGSRNLLDIYMPAAKPEKAPVIVFFYGGNWNSGSRADYLFAGEAFASQGFVTVIADYRLYPEVKFPDFLYDSAQAFAWARKNIASYGGDPQRMFLAGHSAGAYNAAMLAYNPDYLKGVGVELSAVKGFIGLAGPYDFLPLTGNLTKEIFGFPDTSPATQPISFVPPKPGSRLVPALLLTAPEDRIVNPGNSLRMAAKLRAGGGSVKELSYPELDHARMVGALAAPLRKRYGPALQDIGDWVRQTP